MPRNLRVRAVVELTGRSRSTIYNDPDFPKPFPISQRAVAWDEQEILDWMARCREARQAA